MNFFNSILVKKDRNYIIINFVTLTKVKLLNIIGFFAIFDPKLDKNLALTSLKFGTSLMKKLTDILPILTDV